LDVTYPAARLAFMVADAAPPLVVTTTGGVAALPSGRHVVLDAAATTTVLAAQPVTPPRGRRHLAQAAYVIYTSGSTGQPKGVVVPHTGLAGYAAAMRASLAIAAPPRVPQLASVSFDALLTELTASWSHGGTLVIVPAAVSQGGAALRTLLVREAVTHLSVAPALLATLEGPSPEWPVATVMVAGEACPPAVVATWAARRMVNAYGPTEATVCATVSAPLLADGTAPPIGRPVGSTRV
jgi:non-ribosomal peptide synthetase component F